MQNAISHIPPSINDDNVNECDEKKRKKKGSETEMEIERGTEESRIIYTKRFCVKHRTMEI